ncbi:MAG: VOC family protein [Sphingomonadaceae bacterium]
MTIFGFGQSLGQIIQTAYVVEDIHESIEWWVTDAKTGPWFLLDSFLGADHVYRGAPSTADVKIAMGFAGHMCIELIQPLDDNPSVYRETVQARGYGFHHLGLAVADVDAEIPHYEARGYDLAFRAGVPSGGAVAYMDGGPANPGFLELIPATAGMDALFTKFWRASVDWDGIDPVRAFG